MPDDWTFHVGCNLPLRVDSALLPLCTDTDPKGRKPNYCNWLMCLDGRVQDSPRKPATPHDVVSLPAHANPGAKVQKHSCYNSSRCLGGFSPASAALALRLYDVNLPLLHNAPVSPSKWRRGIVTLLVQWALPQLFPLAKLLARVGAKPHTTPNSEVLRLEMLATRVTSLHLPSGSACHE